MTSREETIDFLMAADYFDQLVVGIPRAKKRIVIHAMTILWGPTTGIFVPLLEDALERGVKVTIVGDYYSKFYANKPSFARKNTSPKWSYTRAMNYRLEDAGAKIIYIGKIGLNPYKGRTHSKATIIDDDVYTFGGVNFTSDSFDNHDYMLHLKSPVLAGYIENLVTKIASGKPLKDISKKINKHTTLLFDSGSPGKSIIYETACDVVSKAQNVYFVSQMCPSGRLAKEISQTDYECYFIRASQADAPANFALLFDKARYHMTNLYKGKRYIHAKYILCEYADGSKHIVSGSNNFSWRGIAYGTKEIAIHSTDPKLWDVFFQFTHSHIKN